MANKSYLELVPTDGGGSGGFNTDFNNNAGNAGTESSGANFDFDNFSADGDPLAAARAATDYQAKIGGDTMELTTEGSVNSTIITAGQQAGRNLKIQ